MTSDENGINQIIDGVVERLLRYGIDGIGPLESASAVASSVGAATPDDDAAIDRIIREHVRLAATEGFLTGLGGFLTLPVALPANVLSFYVLATRMVAAIAAVRGHDVHSDAVRTAVLLVLSGDDATDVLRKAGVMVGRGRMTSLVTRGLPATALMAVNKGVAFRLMVQLGEHGLSRFGRLIPGLGGLLGAGLDAYLMRRLAKRAREDFTRVSPPTGRA